MPATCPFQRSEKTFDLGLLQVLDLTRFQNGPSATRRLADYGATVLKVEHPNGGDAGRAINIMSDGFDLFNQVSTTASVTTMVTWCLSTVA